MLPIQEYAPLPTSTKICSQQLWVAELLTLTNQPNINQLGIFLAKQFPTICQRKKHSKYFYKKQRGETIRDQHFVFDLDKKLPGTARMLFNPLWALLANKQLTEAEALAYAEYFPPSIRRFFMRQNFSSLKYDRKSIYSLAGSNSIDGLAALLLLYLRKDSEDSTYLRHLTLHQMTYLLLRLFSTRYKYSKVNWFLVEALARQINITPSHTHTQFVLWEEGSAHLVSMPVALTHFESPKSVQQCCLLHQYLAHEIVDALSLDHKTFPPEEVLLALNYEKLDELTWNVYESNRSGVKHDATELMNLRQRLIQPR